MNNSRVADLEFAQKYSKLILFMAEKVPLFTTLDKIFTEKMRSVKNLDYYLFFSCMYICPYVWAMRIFSSNLFPLVIFFKQSRL